MPGGETPSMTLVEFSSRPGNLVADAKRFEVLHALQKSLVSGFTDGWVVRAFDNFRDSVGDDGRHGAILRRRVDLEPAQEVFGETQRDVPVILHVNQCST